MRLEYMLAKNSEYSRRGTSLIEGVKTVLLVSDAQILVPGHPFTGTSCYQHTCVESARMIHAHVGLSQSFSLA